LRRTALRQTSTNRIIKREKVSRNQEQGERGRVLIAVGVHDEEHGAGIHDRRRPAELVRDRQERVLACRQGGQRRREGSPPNSKEQLTESSACPQLCHTVSQKGDCVVGIYNRGQCGDRLGGRVKRWMDIDRLTWKRLSPKFAQLGCYLQLPEKQNSHKTQHRYCCREMRQTCLCFSRRIIVRHHRV
jgi:hypothetical protein